MGFAGRIAGRFLNSRLTPLVTLASLAAGAMALVATPREEEPQISVPMIDVIAAMPGAAMFGFAYTWNETVETPFVPSFSVASTASPQKPAWSKFAFA